MLPEDRVAFLCWASSRSSLRRVQSARFTQLTSRVVDRCFRGPFEEQALRTPFSSQPDSFWFKSPLLAFRTPHQPKLLRDVAWQRERLSLLVPSPGVRPDLQGFAGRLPIKASYDYLMRSLSYTWLRLQRLRKLSRCCPSACASVHHLPPLSF